MAARRILALNLLLLPAELVHRLGVLRHVAAVSLALDRVADEVAAFLLFAGLATVGFAGTLTAQIRGVPAYSQFTRSCRELLLAALGEMNFDDIVDTQLFWGPTLLTCARARALFSRARSRASGTKPRPRSPNLPRPDPRQVLPRVRLRHAAQPAHRRARAARGRARAHGGRRAHRE